MVKSHVEERVRETGKLIIKTNKTLRELAKDMGVSKSTVHNDLTTRLPLIADKHKIEIVRKILKQNKEEKHIRGGESTKNKYKEVNKN